MADGDPITVVDNTSIAKFGINANALGWPHNDLLLANDADVERLVHMVLNQQKDDFIGVSEIEVDADQDPAHLYGVLSNLLSRGIGQTGHFDIHWVHPSGATIDQDLRMIGCHGVITMEGSQAKMTANIRTAANQGPAISAAAWVTSHAYTVGKIVADGGAIFQCILAHTSSSTNEPGVGVSWTTYWDDTP